MSLLKEHIISDFSNAELLDNFRLAADGTLEKREGYALLGEFDYPVRGVASDEHVTYAVSGNYLYRITEDSVYYADCLDNCVFENEHEAVTMFMESGALYIIGGGEFYKYSPSANELSVVSGYVPLIRRGASDSSVGEPYEAPNLLTSRVRISAFTENIENSVKLWGFVSKIISVYYGNTVLNPDQYTLNTTEYDVSYLVLQTDFSNITDELFVEYELAPLFHPIRRKELFTGTKSYINHDDLKTRLFLYGSTEGKVYTSEIGAFHTHETERLDYFTETSNFIVGDAAEPILGIQQLGLRTVFMTAGAIFELTASKISTSAGIETKKFSTKTVTGEMGISEKSGIVLYDDELYFMNENGLYKFAYNAETFDYYAIRIDFADYCAPHFSEYSQISLFLLRSRHELWCVHKDGAYVYSLRFKCWYNYSGFNAVGHMFLHCKNAAFCTDNSLYAFKENSYTDAGKGFDAVYMSKVIDLGNIFRYKALYGFGAAFDRIENAKLRCSVTSDYSRTAEVEFSAENSADPSPLSMFTHLKLGRSKYFVCKLVSSASDAPANVRKVIFRYREFGGAK